MRRMMSSSRFLDGGIIDNLPLDAVAEYLDRVLTDPLHRRPEMPHLLKPKGAMQPLADLIGTVDHGNNGMHIFLPRSPYQRFHQ